jgi:hypothetical protein
LGTGFDNVGDEDLKLFGSWHVGALLASWMNGPALVDVRSESRWSNSGEVAWDAVFAKRETVETTRPAGLPRVWESVTITGLVFGGGGDQFFSGSANGS